MDKIFKLKKWVWYVILITFLLVLLSILLFFVPTRFIPDALQFWQQSLSKQGDGGKDFSQELLHAQSGVIGFNQEWLLAKNGVIGFSQELLYAQSVGKVLYRQQPDVGKDMLT